MGKEQLIWQLEHMSAQSVLKRLYEHGIRARRPYVAPIGRASLVFILRDVTRFTPLLSRLVQ